MPFVQRTVEPKNLSQKSLLDESGRSLVSDYELEAVANNTLSNVLRQLASLVLVANDIFEDLARQLQDVHDRSSKLKVSIHLLEDKLAGCDPRTVTVPEGDICSFSLRSVHFKSTHPVATNLFTRSTRPASVQRIYEAAAPTPVHTIRQLDRFRRDGARSSKFFVCTPVLSGRRKKYNKKVDLEIETRKPVAVEDLRRWTSAEAMGDLTVLPDNTSKITTVSTISACNGETKATDEVDHLLPSPEEQMMALAMRFPPSIVAVDISGKAFDRMSGMRRSLIQAELTSDGTVGRRKVRNRRHREKRRNTIAGTSQKEIQQAIAGETTTETEGCEFEPMSPLRSKSGDLFKLSKSALSPADNIRNHFNTLKKWSKTKLKLINRNGSSSDSCRPSFQGTDIIDDVDIYETITAVKRRREKERKPSTSSSAISIPASSSSIATSLAVKLRENSLQRRHRRKGGNKGQDEPVHSSSGNWSASSESGRTSIASETTAPPKSSTTTSSNSLNHNGILIQGPPPSSVHSRRRYLNASTSSSVSEGTITPDINDINYHDLDGETSSVYSCDTEGYYTSFHMDSGLKTLKEEEIALSFSTLQLPEAAGPTTTTTTFNSSSGSGSSTVKMNQLTAENEYELFGKGSTSTTTSSAGTVCTTLLANGHGYGSTRSLSQFAPAVPERKSSLERRDKKRKGSLSDELDLISDQKYTGSTIIDSPSPDSGHNTSSSPAESTSQNSHSPNEHLDFSESDLEGCERVERIRSKTAMTSCRIPSMCVITPPQSDDEMIIQNYNQVPYDVKFVPLNQSSVERDPTARSSFHIRTPEAKKGLDDIYALPDKSKKTTKSVGAKPNLGMLETDLDSVSDGYASVNGKSGEDDGEYVRIGTSASKTEAKKSDQYVSLDELPRAKTSPTSDRMTENGDTTSLERKKRTGARVTLDSDGKVVYSSDSLKRRKQHSTFVPGRYVRDEPTPSPVADRRLGKQVRPVNCSGLVRTNGETPRGKIIIRAGATKEPVRSVRGGARIALDKSNGSASPSSSSVEAKRSESPTSSSSSSNEARTGDTDEGVLYDKPEKWISTHPAVSQRQQQEISPNGYPRSHPMYWTLPSQRSYESPSSSKSDHGRLEKSRTSEFLSSTPTKASTPALSSPMNGMSPILKDNFLSPRTTMTSEEIFTAIHKSRKKLIMRDTPDKARDRSSWSPESCDPVVTATLDRNQPRTRKSWTSAASAGGSTPMNTFKKLLLQHGRKNKDGRLSAVEQLKLSKENPPSPQQQQQQQQQQKQQNPPLLPRAGALTLRGGRPQWRFASPRTDVLSSTIPEDCSEVEKQDESPTEKKQQEKEGLCVDSRKQPSLADSSPDTSVVRTTENRATLEMTRKSLEEARKNFFRDVKPATSPVNMFRSSLPSAMTGSPSRSVATKVKTSIISLETAL